MLDKKTLLTALLCCVICFSAGAATNVIRILAIGNSFSDNALEQHLYELAKNNGDSLVIGNVYYPSCSVDMHWNNAQKNVPAYQYRKIVGGVKTTLRDQTMLACIRDEAWDYVSFQQASYSSGQCETYAHLPQLMQYVTENLQNRDVQYLFHMTWAYAEKTEHKSFKDYNFSQPLMYHAIVTATNRAVSAINSDAANQNKIAAIVPAGVAIQRARATSVGDNLCGRDGFHLNTLGRYCAACVWLEILTGKSAVGNGYQPADMSKKEAATLQKCAAAAVADVRKHHGALVYEAY